MRTSSLIVLLKAVQNHVKRKWALLVSDPSSSVSVIITVPDSGPTLAYAGLTDDAA